MLLVFLFLDFILLDVLTFSGPTKIHQIKQFDKEKGHMSITKLSFVDSSMVLIIYVHKHKQKDK